MSICPQPVAADLVIDALIGYSLHGDPHGRTAQLIDWANGQPAPVLALDVPSGLDPTLGVPATPGVTATVTLTLGLPKTGLLHPAQVGELYVADIGIPPGVYQQFGITAAGLFNRSEIVAVPTARHPHPPTV